jgi:quercetin dioxygenase-like cupin family protein
MRSGARTPEELETLLEDASVVRDREALAELFEDGAVLIAGERPQEARGEEIAPFALTIWDADHAYVADPRGIFQTRDMALVVAERSINVLRRGRDGAWRYAISLMSLEDTTRTGNGGHETGTHSAKDGSIGERGRMTSVTRTTQISNDTRRNDGAATDDPQQTSQTAELKPVAVHADEGEARWWFNTLAVIKATAADTAGQMSIIEVTNPPGFEGPLHVHHREDEGFWILEGDATIQVGDTTIEVHPGDYAFGPRDIPHRYSVGDSGCRMLFILTPGGMEGLVIATSEPATSRTLPPPSGGQPDIEKIRAIAEAYGNELLV